MAGAGLAPKLVGPWDRIPLSIRAENFSTLSPPQKLLKALPAGKVFCRVSGVSRAKVQGQVYSDFNASLARENENGIRAGELPN